MRDDESIRNAPTATKSVAERLIDQYLQELDIQGHPVTLRIPHNRVKAYSSFHRVGVMPAATPSLGGKGHSGADGTTKTPDTRGRAQTGSTKPSGQGNLKV